MLVHFPIALLIVAAAAECVLLAGRDERWRLVVTVCLRAGAASAVVAATAGWLLAAATDASVVLEWHRWLGTAVAAFAVLAAIAGALVPARQPRIAWLYRASLFAAGLLIPIAGHLGGVLVWGEDFLRP